VAAIERAAAISLSIADSACDRPMEKRFLNSKKFQKISFPMSLSKAPA
jgi:hypothetical protein